MIFQARKCGGVNSRGGVLTDFEYWRGSEFFQVPLVIFPNMMSLMGWEGVLMGRGRTLCFGGIRIVDRGSKRGQASVKTYNMSKWSSSA